MEEENFTRLIGELRAQASDLAAAVHLLTPLVTERGGEKETRYLASVNRSLYQLVRTVYHLELCGEEDHAFLPQIIDVAGLCRDLSRQVEGVSGLLGIGFDWHLEKESVLSWADGELLDRAVLNMLTNAFSAAGKGGRVSLRFAVKGGRFTITVSDDGQGLTGGEANALRKSGAGVGLGLEGARRVARLHGGELMLDSREGAGVRAVLSLPLRTPERKELLCQEKRMPYDRTGGFSPLLVEFSPLLGPESFFPEDLE